MNLVQEIGKNQAEDSQAKFKDREVKLLDEIQKSVDYYVRYGRSAQRWQRSTAVAVMILSTFAPLLVASSTTTVGGNLGLPAGTVSIAAFVVTLLLALLEGVRRIFRFEQRWMACYMAKQVLKREREKYRFARIGLDVGSDAWKANFAELRKAYDEVTGSETKDFFASMQAPIMEPKKQP